MARKLDGTQDGSTEDGDGPLFGRRDYVKAGMLSTAAGAGIVGASIPGAARGRQSIHIAGTGSLAIYEITVSGDLWDAEDTVFDASENISGGNAEGTVQDDVHGYLFAGNLEDVRVEGEAVVYKNGERLDRSKISRR